MDEDMVTYEAVTPDDDTSGGIAIRFGIHPSPFGLCLLGVTPRGICHLSFVDAENPESAGQVIAKMWPHAEVVHAPQATKSVVDRIFSLPNKRSRRPLHLLIKGTHFQINVWKALMAIPEGQTSNYAAIAKAAGSPKAVRAAGTACGRNPIAYLIPCHRVLTSAGGLGGYRWGADRKKVMLALEQAQLSL